MLQRDCPGIGYESTSILEHIVDYMRLFHQVCKVKVFVFVGIKAFLSEEEMLQLYQMATYENIELLLIEGRYYSCTKYERNVIIDKDRCLITI